MNFLKSVKTNKPYHLIVFSNLIKFKILNQSGPYIHIGDKFREILIKLMNYKDKFLQNVFERTLTINSPSNGPFHKSF